MTSKPTTSSHLEVQEFVTDRINRLKGKGRERIIVSIAGGSATLKSTKVAKKLYETFRREASLLQQDNYMIGIPFLDVFDHPHKWDHPAHFSPPELERHLLEYRSGANKISIPTFSIKEVKRTEGEILSCSTILFIDGIYAHYGRLEKHIDIRVYTESPFYARLLRRIIRGHFELDKKSLEKGIVTVIKEVEPAHQEFVVQQRSSADIIFKTDYSFKKSIELFDLKPGEMPEDVKTIKSLPIGSESELVLSNAENGNSLAVKHKELWFQLADLTTKTTKELAKIDWLSC